MLILSVFLIGSKLELDCCPIVFSRKRELHAAIVAAVRICRRFRKMLIGLLPLESWLEVGIADGYFIHAEARGIDYSRPRSR